MDLEANSKVRNLQKDVDTVKSVMTENIGEWWEKIYSSYLKSVCVGGICTYESVRTLRVCCQDNYESTLYKRTYLSDFDKKW